MEMRSDPSIDAAMQAECIRQGLDQMTRCQKQSVLSECVEAVMREAMPQVFDVEKR